MQCRPWAATHKKQVLGIRKLEYMESLGEIAQPLNLCYNGSARIRFPGTRGSQIVNRNSQKILKDNENISKTSEVPPWRT
jgi:hypothetical protein